MSEIKAATYVEAKANASALCDSFIERLKAFRREFDYSITALAEYLDIKRDTMSSILSGKSALKYEHYLMLNHLMVKKGF